MIKDLIKIAKIKPLPRRPKCSAECELDILKKLTWIFYYPNKSREDFAYTSKTVTEDIIFEGVKQATDYINKRYDCSDFRISWLLKLVYSGGERLFNNSKDNAIYKEIEQCLTNASYWITDKQEGSMCLYSENHQVVGAVTEILAGQLFEDTVFFDGKKGKEHIARGQERLMLWFDQRLKYGFSEFLSHNYLPINVCALALLLHYGKDDNLKKTATKVLDIIFYDYALQLYKNTFIGPQGRAYPRNNFNSAYGEYNSNFLIELLWGDKPFVSTRPVDEQIRFFYDMYLDRDKEGKPYYTLPDELLHIGKYDKEMEVRVSSGLTLKEMGEKGLIGQSDNALMFQLGMGALTNPEVVTNTLEAVEANNLWRNNFLSAMKFLNIGILKKNNRMVKFFTKVNAFPNGMALERHNTYTYKTKDYKLCSVQKYRVGTAGAQQTTMALTLDDGVTVYTANPARLDKWEQAPSYWGGYGVAPDCVQRKNVCLMIHNIPRKFFLAPTKTPQLTHTFFPTELFDEYKLVDNYAFLRKNNAVVAIIGKNKLSLMPYDKRIQSLSEQKLKRGQPFDLVQRGKHQFTIYEVSDITKEGNFDNFIQRIMANTISFEKNILKYTSDNNSYVNNYGGAFLLNGEEVNLEFLRYSSLFGTTEREAKTIVIADTLKINLKDSKTTDKEEDV